MANVDVLIRFLAEKDGSFATSLASVKAEVEAAAKASRGGFTQAGAGAGALTAAVGVLGRKVIESAKGSDALYGSMQRGARAATASVGQASAALGTLGDRLEQDVRRAEQLRKAMSEAGGHPRVTAVVSGQQRPAERLAAQGAALPAGGLATSLPAPQAASLVAALTRGQVAAQTFAAALERAGATGQEAGKKIDHSMHGAAAGLKSAHGHAHDLAMDMQMAGMNLQMAGMAMGALAAGAAAGIGALLGQFVTAASQMEQFRAKLETVLKSATEARQAVAEAVRYAAITPFNVEQVVASAVQLEVYGAKARQVLPLVGDLAAGMGKRVEDAALVVGKAWSGSLEGFESLRNEYGISTAKLAKYGAVLEETGGISVRTTANLARARQALASIIQLEFGGAVERQSKTFQGALSNLQDALIRTAAAFGDRMIPMLTDMARAVMGLVERFEKLPNGLKDLIVLGTVGAGAMAVLGAGVFGVVTLTGSLVSSIGGLVTFINTMAAASATATVAQGGLAAAFGASGAAAAALATRVAAAGTALLGLATNPVVLGLVAVAGAVILVRQQTAEYERAQIAAGKAMEEQSRSLHRVIADWREYREIVNAAASAHGGFVSGAANVAEMVRQVREAMAAATPLDLAKALSAKGLGLEDVKRALTENEAKLKAVTAQIVTLQHLARLTEGNYKISVKSLLPENRERMEALFPGMDVVPVEKIRGALQGLQAQIPGLRALNVALHGTVEALDPMNDALQRVEKVAASVKSYLDLSDKLGTLDAYTQKLAVLDDALARMARNLASQGLPTEQQGVLALLRDEKLPADIRKSLETYAGMLAERRQTVDAAEKKEREDREQRIQAIRSHMDREGQLRTVSARERVSYTRQMLEIARGDKVLEPQLLHELAAANKAARDEDVKNQRTALEAKLAASQDLLARLKATNQLTPQEEAAALQREINAVRRWQSEHRAMLKDPANRELAESTNKTLRGLIVEQARATADGWRSSFDQMQRSAQRFLTAQETGSRRSTVQQIQDIRTVLAYAEDAIRRRAVREKDAHDYVAWLRKQAADLERRHADEMRDLQRSVASAQRDVVQAQLDAALKRRQAGADNQDEIVGLIRQRLVFELAAIDEEARRRREAHQGDAKAQRMVDEETAYKRDLLLRRTRDEVRGIIDEQTKGMQTLDAQLREIQERYSSGRMGGRNSPMQSLAEVGEQTAARLGMSFRLELGGQAAKPAGPVDKLQAFAAQLEAPIKAMDADLKTATAATVNLTVALQDLTGTLRGGGGVRTPLPAGPSSVPVGGRITPVVAATAASAGAVDLSQRRYRDWMDLQMERQRQVRELEGLREQWERNRTAAEERRRGFSVPEPYFRSAGPAAPATPVINQQTTMYIGGERGGAPSVALQNLIRSVNRQLVLDSNGLVGELGSTQVRKAGF